MLHGLESLEVSGIVLGLVVSVAGAVGSVSSEVVALESVVINSSSLRVQQVPLFSVPQNAQPLSIV